jgi:hypothetical protein
MQASFNLQRIERAPRWVTNAAMKHASGPRPSTIAARLGSTPARTTAA